MPHRIAPCADRRVNFGLARSRVPDGRKGCGVSLAEPLSIKDALLLQEQQKHVFDTHELVFALSLRRETDQVAVQRPERDRKDSALRCAFVKQLGDLSRRVICHVPRCVDQEHAVVENTGFVEAMAQPQLFIR